jgi:beta-glucosidase
MNNRKINEIISKLSLHEKIQLCMGRNSWRTNEIEQYHIPSLHVSDGTNGIRYQTGSEEEDPPYFRDCIHGSFDSAEAMEKTHAATCYPSGSAMACAWNRKLMNEVGRNLALECRALGIRVLLGPGMNIRRHPLTARNFEYYSEDPCLSGETAAAMVNGVQSMGVGSSIKHFLCHNSDDRRTRVNVTVDERALREIYLAGFERAVKKAHPATVMTAYNQINGEEISESTMLLRDILRKEWGYQGLVISDWGTVKDSVKATTGGLDLQMPCSMSSAEKLERCVKEGKIDEKLVDERVRHILRLVFEYSKPCTDHEKFNATYAHQLSEKAAEETIVLLKNKNHLFPLDPNGKRKIAVIGRYAKEAQFVGSGCAIVRSENIDIPFDEIKSAAGNDAVIVYAPGYDEKGGTTSKLLGEAKKAAKDADVALIFAGTTLPNESDLYNRKNMALDAGQCRMIEELQGTAENTAVILSGGDVIEMPWIDKTDAVFETWYGGEGMGKALANILFGRTCPSGKLPVTVPKQEKDAPAYLTFHSDPFHKLYGESYYVGYRYYDKKGVEPLFPFGFGLSYTSFEYSAPQLLSESDDKVRVAVDIKNTGEREGKETAELYVSPRNSFFDRPVRELKGYEKVNLKPGQKKTLVFELDRRDFSCFDPVNHKWTVDSASYDIEFASSSRDIREKLRVRRKKDHFRIDHLNGDCGFYEMFSNRVTKKMFFDFAEARGLLTKEQVTKQVQESISNSFWSVRSYLDMFSHGMVSDEEIDDLIYQMNEVLDQHE